MTFLDGKGYCITVLPRFRVLTPKTTPVQRWEFTREDHVSREASRILCSWFRKKHAAAACFFGSEPGPETILGVEILGSPDFQKRRLSMITKISECSLLKGPGCEKKEAKTSKKSREEFSLGRQGDIIGLISEALDVFWVFESSEAYWQIDILMLFDIWEF